MSAITAVFNTYELLEHILLHLPIRDLLVNERVCKSWRSLIARSTPISQALFRTSIGMVDKERVRLAPIILIINPFVEYLTWQEDSITRCIRAAFTGPESCVHYPRACYNADASWRCMVPTQPTFARYDFECRRTQTMHRAHGPLGQLQDRMRCHQATCERCYERSIGRVEGLEWAGDPVSPASTGRQVLAVLHNAI